MLTNKYTGSYNDAWQSHFIHSMEEASPFCIHLIPIQMWVFLITGEKKGNWRCHSVKLILSELGLCLSDLKLRNLTPSQINVTQRREIWLRISSEASDMNQGFSSEAWEPDSHLRTSLGPRIYFCLMYISEWNPHTNTNHCFHWMKHKHGWFV